MKQVIGILLLCLVMIYKAEAQIGAPFFPFQAANFEFEDLLGLFQNDRVLEPWESVCQLVHNQVRYVHHLPPLRWNDLFLSLADARVIEMMYRRSRFDFSSIDITRQFFRTGDLAYSGAEVNFTVPEAVLMQPSALPGLLASHVELILRNWYLHGVFNLSGDGHDMFLSMINPFSDVMGCSIRASASDETTIAMYMVVAYHRRRNQGGQIASVNSYVEPDSERSCNVTCSEEQKCISHLPITFLSSRVGDTPTIPPGDRCNCLSNDDGASTNPFCTGNCFVHCPLAGEGTPNSCHGKLWCRCNALNNTAACL